MVYVTPVPPTIGALMPMSGQAYTTGPSTMTPVGTHPIVIGLGPDLIDSYAAYANQALTDGTNPVALQVLMRSIEWAGKALN